MEAFWPLHSPRPTALTEPANTAGLLKLIAVGNQGQQKLLGEKKVVKGR